MVIGSVLCPPCHPILRNREGVVMTIKKSIALVCLFVCVVFSLPAQDTKALLDSYLRNFDRGDAAVKLQLIQDAVKRNDAGLAPLFMHAIDSAVNKSERLKNESTIRLISGISVEQVEKFKYTEARQVIWELFAFDVDTNIRVKCLKALGVLAAGDKAIIARINEFLDQQITTFKAGKKPVLNVILRTVITLGELADDSSFVVIFNTVLAGFNQETTNAGREILIRLKGDFKALILAIVKNGTIREKKEILVIALQSQALTDADKGDIAIASLDTSLRSGSRNAQEIRDMRDTRILANRAISERKLKSALQLILQYFEIMLADYERGTASKPDLLETIRCLGAMDSPHASVRLVQYLDMLNSYTEQKKVFDEQIVLETIDSLGNLGFQDAFDTLMNVRFLPYNATIKTRADQAIKNLKW